MYQIHGLNANGQWLDLILLIRIIATSSHWILGTIPTKLYLLEFD